MGACLRDLMTVPVGVDHQFTYKFTDLFKFETIAELPLNNPQFALVVNGAGPWQGSLKVEDKKVRETDWIVGTSPWLAAMWVDIDGDLFYGGPVTGRTYQQSAGVVNLTGIDFCGYLSQRLQAQDYTAYTDPEGHNWLATGAPVPRIAFYLLQQAMEKESSIPIDIAYEENAVDEIFWITFTAPLTQQQTLMGMMTQLQQLGYLVGMDYAADVQYVAGKPSVSITVSYPRRGSTLAETIIEVSDSTEMSYAEDGSQSGNRIVEQTGAISAAASSGSWAPATKEDGYPLLEKVVAHSALSPTPASEAVLQAYVKGDLAIYTYPLTTPVVTLPMFGSPSINDLTPIGKDVMLRIPTGEGDLPDNNPRFPNGLDYRFRTVRLDCSVPDAGLATMAATLNIPPGTVPPVPPV